MCKESKKNEFLIEKNSPFVTKYGSTMDEECPSVIYLRTKSKITPLLEKKEYNDEVIKIKDRFNDFVHKTVMKSKSLENDYLFNIDMSEKSVKFGKVSFLRYDIYVKPTKKQNLQKNFARMSQLSHTLDKKLENLLMSNGIICQ